MDGLLESILNSKNEEKQIYLGTVTTIYPLTIKLYPLDDPIAAKAVSGLRGVKVGSNVLMTKYLNKFIITGVITEYIQPYCLLEKTSTQAVSNETFTFLDFSSSTTATDEYSMFDGTNKITVPIGGIYQVNVGFRWADSLGGGKIRITEIHLNGAAVHTVISAPDVQNGRSSFNIALNLNLSSNDYIQIKAYQSSGGSLNVGAYDNTYFSVVQIS